MNAKNLYLVLTATTAISHHDASAGSTGNAMTFNREKRLLNAPPVPPFDPSPIAAKFPVPEDLAPALEGLSAGDLAAIAVVRTFVAMYGGVEGSGLFSGIDRYQVLDTRLRKAGLQSTLLRPLWDNLTNGMLVGVSAKSHDEELLALWSLPKAAQMAACRALALNAGSCIAIAREWSKLDKNAGGLFAGVPVPLAPEAGGLVPVELPAISANGSRHQVVREPSMRHLLASLDIPYGHPGEGDLPLSVEALFYNGGNIKAGAKQISGAFAAAHEVRRAFPSLDLLGGVTDSFDLGASRLGVASWLACQENEPAFYGTPLEGELLPSAYDLLDVVTQTRQEGRTGLGQMIHNFEVLVPGTKILIRLSLEPFTPDLTAGALECAVQSYAEAAKIGGQYARGFGSVTIERDGPDLSEHAEQYETYLAENKDALREALIGGTLGTGKVVLS